jgi:murein L,D-transpeptidase YafK
MTQLGPKCGALRPAIAAFFWHIARSLVRSPAMRLLVLLLALVVAAPCLAANAPKGKIDLVVVEKAKRVMTLYVKKKPFKTYRIALGGNPVGHKEQEGDSRTPEGRYVIDAKNPKSSFHLSLHISYPDRRDRAAARRKGVSPGGAIMIHGTPEYMSSLRAAGIFSDWTAGCIAVTNAEIEEIYRIVPTGTPIVIKP